MTTTATDTPDGESLARLEVRVEHLELQNSEIHQDIRALRTEHREDFQRLQESIQRLESQQQHSFLILQTQLDAQRSRADRQFLWILGIVITMWVSAIALGATAAVNLSNRLGG